MSDVEALGQAIEELTTNIQNAAQRVDEGTVMQMESLAETVDALCTAVGQLGNDAAQVLKPQMVELITSLDDLGTRLQRFMDEKREEMGRE